MNVLAVVAVLLFSAQLSARAPRMSGHALVPAVVGLDLGRAYSRLHAAGLRVSYPHTFSDGSFIDGSDCEPIIGRQRPAAGQLVTSTSTTVLSPRRSLCTIESPVLSPGPLPSATVPSFAGKTVLIASRWAAQHSLDWQADALPPLRSGNADELLTNYEIRSQTPGAGMTLTLGIAHKFGPHGGSFLPTPLVLHATQTHRTSTSTTP
jgi:hypothetical protein